MQRHTIIGSEILRDVTSSARPRPSSAPTTSAGTARAIPTGWPARQIPIAARVFAVADTFDALDDRPPLPARMGIAAARAVIEAEAGAQFDPAVVAAFTGVEDADAGADRAGAPVSAGSVLIVDDDPFIRKLIATTLGTSGDLELHEAGDGEEALVLAAEPSARPGLPRRRDAAAGRHRRLPPLLRPTTRRDDRDAHGRR